MTDFEIRFAAGRIGSAARFPDDTGGMPELSVLDLIPVRSDQTTADALNATIELAKAADELGYKRYWLAEHHNVPAVAATNPAVTIALLASQTNRIRVGSGGVMLPNHAPLSVAEQFSLLEARFPGRIDLGIGRAPGTDPVTSWALRNTINAEQSVEEYPQHVQQVAQLLTPQGLNVNIGGRLRPIQATPESTSTPPIWLLGSSAYSAQLAAELGMPYVFAHHFAGTGTTEAIELYRSKYQPSTAHPEPQTFLSVNAVVAESTAEAFRLAQPQIRSMLALRAGGPLDKQLLVENAEAQELDVDTQSFVDAMLRSWLIGDPATVNQQIDRLCAQFDVDEVMVQPVAGAFAGTPANQSPARIETLRLLAG